MSFPEIDPVFFHLGPLPIRWYALAYLAGIALGWIYLNRLLKQQPLWNARGSIKNPETPPLDKEKLDDFVSWIILGVILGGRLGFVLFYRPELMWQSLSEWPQLLGTVPIWPPLAVWTGGMSFHGGLIGVAIVTVLFAKKRGTDPLRIGDLLACAAPIGLFFGRLANFINAELYGRATDSWIGMRFPQYYDRASGEWVYAADAVPRHPSQLYEAALEGLVLFIVIRIAVTRFRILRFRGAATGLFLLGYGASRFFVEFFREPDTYAATLGFLTRGMLLSLPMVLLGAFLFYRVHPKLGGPARSAA
ncbi:prolipoprotein diacylglyceryl transferase [Parvularcula sp. ZS-1/3]|uniref:Phosphatidylglycerol--prolipoprotein diacylglyceryl transferase n=1 Tax=Parvularcula mediterranea TaxID=2732508 RepID=A0A7Y3RLV0_9PROT|nr:prolipoprotein diacylglyceryl transferase [Parvularcula mediterranea]NNU16375.1 prolipoprotein diacylglyceryl transferase [Parvularcula mediterranea]